MCASSIENPNIYPEKMIVGLSEFNKGVKISTSINEVYWLMCSTYNNKLRKEPRNKEIKKMSYKGIRSSQRTEWNAYCF